MLAIISSHYQYGPFYFFAAKVMSNYLTTDGLKNFSLLPEAPLRLVVNPALPIRRSGGVSLHPKMQ